MSAEREGGKGGGCNQIVVDLFCPARYHVTVRFDLRLKLRLYSHQTKRRDQRAWLS